MPPTNRMQQLDISRISEEKLNDPVEIEKIATVMVADVNRCLLQTYDSSSQFDKLDPAYALANTFINDIPVHEYLDEMYKEKPLHKSQQARMGALLIARAMLEGDEVATIPKDADYKQRRVLNSAFKAVAPRTLNLWERFWSHFGLYKDKKMEVESHARVVKSIKKQIYSMQVYTENLSKADRTALVAENRSFIDKQIESKHQFITLLNDQKNQINNLYFDGVDPSYFVHSSEKSTHYRGETLPSTDNFNSRSANVLANCVMLGKGHSLEQICDPTFTTDRQEVGQYVAELSRRIQSKDKTESDKAAQEIADIYVIGAEKFLAQPLPPKAEVDNFLQSKRPLYLQIAAWMGGDISQEFERGSNKTRITSDPVNQVMVDVLSRIPRGGVLAQITSVAQNHTKYVFAPGSKANQEDIQASKERFQDSRMAEEMSEIFERENSDYSGTTLFDYATNNEENGMKDHAFGQISRSGVDSLFTGINDIPLKLEDFSTGKKSITEIVKDTATFQSGLEYQVTTMKKIMGQGTIPERIAKAELSKKLVGRMTESNTDMTDLEKNNLSCQLYKNKDFQDLTDGLPVEMIHELENDQEFFKVLVTSAAPKLPAQVSVPIAPVAVAVVEASPKKAVDGIGI